MSFANNLKMECFYRGIFLKDLAEKIGVNLVTGDISDISGIDRSLYPFMNDLKNVDPVFMDLLIRLIHELAKKKEL